MPLSGTEIKELFKFALTSVRVEQVRPLNDGLFLLLLISETCNYIVGYYVIIWEEGWKLVTIFLRKASDFH